MPNITAIQLLEVEFVKTGKSMGETMPDESELILIALRELAHPSAIDYWALICEAGIGEFEIVDRAAIRMGAPIDPAAEPAAHCANSKQRK